MFLVSQRLYISRHYPWGPLWLPAPKAAAQSDSVHRPAAGSSGENLPEDALPWRGDAWTPGHVHQPARGTCAGKKTNPKCICLTQSRDMNGRFSLFKSRYCALSDSLSYKDSLTFVFLYSALLFTSVRNSGILRFSLLYLLKPTCQEAPWLVRWVRKKVFVS